MRPWNGFKPGPLSRGNYLPLGVGAVVFLFILLTLFQLSPSMTSSPWSEPPSSQKLAYATFLSSRVANDSAPDAYFTAARVLTYQLLHYPETRTLRDIPFLILVAPHVPQWKRDVLASEGAKVIPVDLIEPQTTNWLSPANERFLDQFTKLRLFELEQYDRILYLDSDMLLTKCLDPIFQEPIAQDMWTTGGNPHAIQSDEAPLPASYLFVGVSDSGGGNHDFPPKEGDDLNGGFWLARPDKKLLKYYLSVLNIPNRFPSDFMEQSMLTYAHRKEGNMPWKAFPMGKWNTNWPNLKDVNGGTATLHDKFWVEENKGWIDRKLVEMWWRRQGQMEGYWQTDRRKERVKEHSWP